MSPSFSAVTMKRELATSLALVSRAGVSRRPMRDAVARSGRARSRTCCCPSAMIDTFAPATGAPVSSRVTKTSVFCGLSLTVMPRLVTWTTDARTRLASRRRARCRSACRSRPPSTQAGALRSERLRQVEAVRLDAVGCHAELALDAGDGRRLAEAWLSATASVGISSSGVDRSGPLRDVPEVARVERQQSIRRSSPTRRGRRRSS